MIKLKSSVHIERPVAEVFGFLEDHENRLQWQPGLVSHEHEPLKDGARITEVRNLFGRRIELEGVISGYQKNKGFSFTGHGPFVKRTSYTYRLTPKDGGTQLEEDIEVDSNELCGLAKPVLQRMIQREADMSQAQLKDVLEAHPDLHKAVRKLPVHEHHKKKPAGAGR